jgi:uncharacterized membrane protein
VLAAAGAARLAETVARRVAAGAGPRVEGAVRHAVLGAALLIVLAAVNADLWGDYYLPARWFHVQ